MARNYKPKKKFDPFVALSWKLLNSPAYKDLTPSAAKILPYFLGKVKVHHDSPERYTESFIFPYDEAENLGFTTATFSRVRKELEELGFIERHMKGGMAGRKEVCSKYRLSCKWAESTKPLVGRS